MGAQSRFNTIVTHYYTLSEPNEVAKTQNMPYFAQQYSQRCSTGRMEGSGNAIVLLTHFCTDLAYKTTWVERGHVIMWASAPQLGRFHLKCSNAANLSEDGKTAWTNTTNSFGMAFSKEPIPRRRKFSIKVLEPAVLSSMWPVSQTIDRGLWPNHC